jgi:hypothetical protein
VANTITITIQFGETNKVGGDVNLLAAVTCDKSNVYAGYSKGKIGSISDKEKDDKVRQ